jgi:hypothetical protein
LNGLHLQKPPSSASNSVGCHNYLGPLKFIQLVICHFHVWSLPLFIMAQSKADWKPLPMSCLNSWVCTHTSTHVHLKIFVRYPNSFYWQSRFKDELQVHSNKE